MTRLRQAFIIVYGTGVLLLLALPHSLVRWLDDTRPGIAQSVAMKLAKPLDEALSGLGIASAFDAAHEAFRTLRGH